MLKPNVLYLMRLVAYAAFLALSAELVFLFSYIWVRGRIVMIEPNSYILAGEIAVSLALFVLAAFLVVHALIHAKRSWAHRVKGQR
ncbi:hypothetical protein ES703_33488 [subsurface metagenome]